MVTGQKSYDHKDVFVGDEAWSRGSVLALKSPVYRGMVTDWDEMYKIFEHTFLVALDVTPEEHAVLLTEAPLNPKASRERMARICFETYNVRGLFVAVAAVLALYSAGRETGLSLDCGESVTHCVPLGC